MTFFAFEETEAKPRLIAVLVQTEGATSMALMEPIAMSGSHFRFDRWVDGGI